MANNVRRYCDNPACGRQYRPKTARSQYCSPKCRQAVYVARKARKAPAGTGQARLTGVFAAAAERFKRRAATAAAAPTPEPEPVPEPAQPAAPSRRLPAPDDAPVRVTIKNVPTRFPGTPLPRGYR